MLDNREIGTFHSFFSQFLYQNSKVLVVSLVIVLLNIILFFFEITKTSLLTFTYVSGYFPFLMIDQKNSGEFQSFKETTLWTSPPKKKNKTKHLSAMVLRGILGFLWT